MSMSASTATELNQRVEAFRRLLLDTWNYLPSWMHAADDDGQALRDWLEANWEMLVSCPLNQTLGSQESWVDVKRRSVQHYGEGGVRNAPSKRAFDTDAWTTHEMVLNNVANSDTPIRNGFIERLPTKYSSVFFCRRL